MSELAHQIKHAAQQQSQEHRPFVYGHISSYDPALHRVRCIVPCMRDEAGNFTLTSWMPLQSTWVGPGWGIQIAPMGGATQQNPMAGEMVQIQLIERHYGVSTVASMFFNQTNKPPFPTLQPGEMGMKHKSGSLWQFTADGNLTIMTPTAVVNLNGLTIDKDGNLSTPGKVVQGQGTPDQIGLGTHMHPTAATGSPSPPTPGT